jgi:putative transposase
MLKIDGQNVWFWDIVDKDTRYLLASHVSVTRGTGDARSLLIKVGKRAGKSPKMIVTDKLRAYLDGVAITFRDTEHKQSKPFTTAEDSTNDIERFHGTLKARTKVMRGLKNVGYRYTIHRWLAGTLQLSETARESER